MKNSLIIIAILISLAGIRYLGGLIYRDYQLNNPESVTLEYTKEEYLNQLRENGGHESIICAYSKLIDKYGTNETLKMDVRAAADEKDVDPRIYTAIQECL